MAVVFALANILIGLLKTMGFIAPQHIIRILIILTLSVISSACGGDQNSPSTPPNSAGVDCTSQPLSWNQNGQFCGAFSGIATSGKTVSLIDSADTVGRASFTCTNGSWGVATTPSCAALILAGTTVTDVNIVNTGATQSNVSITFGQVFAQGDLFTSSNSLVGDINGATIPLQVNAKAFHADGTLRHAVISAVIPTISSGQTLTMSLKKAPPINNTPVSPTALLDAGFTASVNVTIGGVAYTASADSLLKGTYTHWLEGAIANEWEVSAPLHQESSPTTLHPHLAARFSIKAYETTSARVEVVIENDWAYEPNPQNFTYDATITVGRSTVYSVSGLKHYHHARWRKLFWWGTTPTVNVEVNKAYLIASKAVPNYDQSITISPAGLTTLASTWNALGSVTNADGFNTKSGPMGQGILQPNMGNTGGRPDIGILTGWEAQYLLSGNSTARNVVLGTGDLSGSWSIHYRDKNTGLPVTLANYPNIGLPGSGASQAMPTLVNDYASPMSADVAHLPDMAYLPYLITGDHYYLEEAQFWANYSMFTRVPNYRGYGEGVVSAHQVRGQAWGMRSIGMAAYATPNADPLKTYFVDRIGDNLTFYNEAYVIANPNSLGIIDGSGENTTLGYHVYSAIEYNTNQGIAPWQDDFFTWSVGFLSDLGFSDADAILAWKAKFPVGRMADAGYCWITGAPYFLNVRNTGAPNAGISSTYPVYATFSQTYHATFDSWIDTHQTSSTYNQNYVSNACNSVGAAQWLTNTQNDGTFVVGRMTGYATSPTGYPANMQPALAKAADSGVVNSASAWNIFNTRAAKPNYSTQPQFAVVPRN